MPLNILFYVGYPLAWAKGGYTTQICETKRGLEDLGLRVRWLHHEAEEIPASNVLHYWSRPPNDQHWQLARQQGMRLVITEIHPGASSRPRWTWKGRGRCRAVIRAVMGRSLYETLGIGIYPNCDAAIALNRAEADYAIETMGAEPARTHVIPNGVDPVFFDRSIQPEPFEGLVCLGYIRELKNSVALARMAKEARVPIRFVGGACFTGDEYVRNFEREVDNRFVYWDGAITDRRRICAILKGSQGCILASRVEAQGIALLESLACGTPVMGPDLPSVRSFFGNAIRYCSPPQTPAFANQLRGFHEACRAGLRQNFAVMSWKQVAVEVAKVYETALQGSDRTDKQPAIA